MLHQDYSQYPFINPDLDYTFNPQYNPQSENYTTYRELVEPVIEESLEESTDCGCGCSGSSPCNSDNLSVYGSAYNSKKPTLSNMELLICVVFLVIGVFTLRKLLNNK